ncbi:phage tail protein [Pseudomonas sp.]|uniref:phage tail protein n=1 Tax=Pseudomonas sp. TaxID=306 RepID=UPI003D6E98E1
MTTANSQFFAILTAIGEAKQANANALGVPWTFSQLGVGDANLTDPLPSREQTRLINERRRAPLNQLKVDPANPNLIIAEQVIPPDVGGWWIREIGLYDADGDLVAVANCAPSFKPLLSQGTGKTQVVRLNIIVTSTANVQLKIDPSVVLATRKYVDEVLINVLPANKTAGTWARVRTNDRGLVVEGDNPLTLAGNGITDAYTREQVDAIIAQASALPVGAMVAFPRESVAPGFLEVDGSVKSIAVYPDLAAYLGTTFNKGDEGAGNFRMPESRAEFLRGWDHGRGVDVGRAIGTYQLDDFKSHTHDLTATPTNWGGRTDTLSGGTGIYVSNSPTTKVSAATGGTETRPRNFAAMWCIKAWNAPVNQGQIDVAALAAQLGQATEVKPGIAKVATQDQANAGDSDEVMITPKKLRKGVTLFRSGKAFCLALPTWLGGYILQVGKTAPGSVSPSGQSFTAAWPVTFPNECIFAAASCDTTGATSNSISSSVFNVAPETVGIALTNSSAGALLTNGTFYFGIGR